MREKNPNCGDSISSNFNNYRSYDNSLHKPHIIHTGGNCFDNRAREWIAVSDWIVMSECNFIYIRYLVFGPFGTRVNEPASSWFVGRISGDVMPCIALPLSAKLLY